MTTDSARYGTTAVSRSSTLRPMCGRAYGARTWRHGRPSGARSFSCGSVFNSAIVALMLDGRAVGCVRPPDWTDVRLSLIPVMPIVQTVTVERARRLLSICLLGLVVLTATAFAASPNKAGSASAPVVFASGVGDLGDTRATIGVALAPRDLHTRVYGEYGTNTGYGNRTAEFLVPPGDDVVGVYRPLAHLEPGTTYHYRWVVSNAAGQLVTPDQTFTTP